MKGHELEIINLALDKMLNRESHFNICAVDKLAKTLGVNCSAHPDYKYLNTLDCVGYAEMSLDLKAKLPEIIMAVLSGHFDTDLMVKALTAVRNGEVKDLPCIEDVGPTTKVVKLFKR